MYRTFEEVFGQETCAFAIREELLNEYEIAKQNSINSCNSYYKEEIGNKFDQEIEKIKIANYSILEATLVETSKVNYIHNQVARKIKNENVTQNQIDYLKKEVQGELEFDEKVLIYNNRYKYNLVKNKVFK